MPAAKSRSTKPASRHTASQKASSKKPAKVKGKPPAAKKKPVVSAGAKKALGAAAKKKAAPTGAKSKGAGANKKQKPPAAVSKKKPAATVSKKKSAAPVKLKPAKAASPSGNKKAGAPAKANAKAPAKADVKAPVPVKDKAPIKIDIKVPAKVEAKSTAPAQVKVKAEEKSTPPPKPPRLAVAKREPSPAPEKTEAAAPGLEAAAPKAAAVKPKAPKPPKLTVVKDAVKEAQGSEEDSAPKPSLMGMPVSSTLEPPLEGGVLVPPEIASEGMQLLCERYPDAQCELNYANAFQLLIAVILSAQTTDANVNRVTPTLFKKFPTPKALAHADSDEVKGLIRSTGYFNSKAKSIQECAKALADRFNSEVPDDIEKLTTLPGVGRKTANVVLGVAFEKPGWTVDTHVQRLSRRLGYTLETDPEKIEQDLQKLFPESEWTKDSITLIWHGRRCCFARNPNCAECPVNKLCPSSRVK